MTRIVLLAAVVGAFALGGATTALGVAGWHVFATGTDQGDYGAFASAHADVLRPKGLAVSATKAADVSWNIICEGETKKASGGSVLVADVAHATKCSLDANADTDSSGKVVIQLLKR